MIIIKIVTITLAKLLAKLRIFDRIVINRVTIKNHIHVSV